MQSFTETAPYSREVLAVAAPIGGVAVLNAVEELARRYFHQATPHGFRKIECPESEDVWIALELIVHGTSEEYRQERRAFFGAWKKAIPAEARAKIALEPIFG